MSLPSVPDTRHGEPSTAIENKKKLRRALLDLRKQLTDEDRACFDRKIGRQVACYLESHDFKSLGVYLPIRNEPHLYDFYTELAKHVPLSLPVTREKDLPLQYVRWKPEDPLVEGTYGVAVPEKQEPVTMPEALLIPCVGYTRNRFRLGYGGGFFDRTLACHPSTHTIGIAYSCLLTDFTTEENDIPLACIITENGIVL